MRLRPSNLVLLLLLLLGTLGSAWAVAPEEDPADEAARLAAEEEKLELLNEKLKGLEEELAALGSRETTLLGELHRLDVQTRVATQQLELLELELERGYREMDENLKRIEALEAEIEQLLPFLSSRFKSLYKLGRLSYLRLLLSVKKPADVTRAYRYISRLAREDGVKMRQFLQDQEALRQAKAEILRQTERMLTTRQQLEATNRTLENRRASREALLAEVYARQEMTGTLLHELEEARLELGKLVEGLAAGEPLDDDTVHLPMRLFEGEIGWPAEGELEGRFGRQLHPRFQTVTVRNGIELDASAGAPVSAVYDGRVVFASWFQGYGKLLIIEHPGSVHSLYGYLADFAVSEGDWVERGQSLGFVGETGSLAGPRLYFEIRVDGKPVDPETWLDPARTLARN